MLSFSHWQHVVPTQWHWPYFQPRELACSHCGRLEIDERLLDTLEWEGRKRGSTRGEGAAAGWRVLWPGGRCLLLWEGLRRSPRPCVNPGGSVWVFYQFCPPVPPLPLQG